MNTESISSWYRERIAEVPGFNFQVESKSSAHIIITTETKGFPPLFSLRFDLRRGILTFEAPVQKLQPTREELIKLLTLAKELDGYLALTELEEGLRPILNLDRRVGGDFKPPRTEFHESFARFVEDFQRLARLLLGDEEASEDPRRSKESKSDDNQTQQKPRQVGFLVGNK